MRWDSHLSYHSLTQLTHSCTFHNTETVWIYLATKTHHMASKPGYLAQGIHCLFPNSNLWKKALLFRAITSKTVQLPLGFPYSIRITGFNSKCACFAPVSHSIRFISHCTCNVPTPVLHTSSTQEDKLSLKISVIFCICLSSLSNCQELEQCKCFHEGTILLWIRRTHVNRMSKILSITCHVNLCYIDHCPLTRILVTVHHNM